MKAFLRNNPWIWIAVPFVLMLGALAGVVVIAEKNKPAQVPLDPPWKTEARPS